MMGILKRTGRNSHYDYCNAVAESHQQKISLLITSHYTSLLLLIIIYLLLILTYYILLLLTITTSRFLSPDRL